MPPPVSVKTECKDAVAISSISPVGQHGDEFVRFILSNAESKTSSTSLLVAFDLQDGSFI